MTKNKAKKEQKRAEQKRQRKVHDQARKQKDAKVRKLLVDSVERTTPRGLAAGWSYAEQPPEAMLGQPLHKLLVAPPPFYAEFLQRLEASGARRGIDQFRRDVLEVAISEWPPGLMMLCSADFQEAEPVAMPSIALYSSPKPDEWLALELQEDDSRVLVAWLTWARAGVEPVPLVLAMDRDRRLALWFLDEHDWHPATMAHLFVQHIAKGVQGAVNEGGLDGLLRVCKARDPAGEFRTPADDKGADNALQLMRSAQSQILRTMLHCASRRDEAEALLDAMVSENERLGSLERDNARLERKLEQVRQEAASTRLALERERAHRGTNGLSAPPPPAVSLSSRLATVFA
jgi:hypothetical protein